MMHSNVIIIYYNNRTSNHDNTSAREIIIIFIIMLLCAETVSMPCARVVSVENAQGESCFFRQTCRQLCQGLPRHPCVPHVTIAGPYPQCLDCCSANSYSSWCHGCANLEGVACWVYAYCAEDAPKETDQF